MLVGSYILNTLKAAAMVEVNYVCLLVSESEKGNQKRNVVWRATGGLFIGQVWERPGERPRASTLVTACWTQGGGRPSGA